MASSAAIGLSRACLLVPASACCRGRPAVLDGRRPGRPLGRPGLAVRAEAEKEAVPAKAVKKDPLAGYGDGEVDIRLRGEAEAPFRPVRLVLYGFSVVSASVGALISLPQLLGALGGAPGALPKEEVLQNLAINVGGASLFAYLFAQDKKAEAVQMARLGREENLGALYAELHGGKLVPLRALRSFARVVVVAGSAKQVNEAVAAAVPLKEELKARGVLLVAVPIFEDAHGTGVGELSPPDLGEADKRFMATGVRLDGWREWFQQQMGMANVQSDRGLYVGLRLDGRVRASGKGCPPWPQFVAELAPMEGMWKGFLDGMDGVV